MRLQQDIYQTFPQEQPNPYMPPDQFVAYVAWPKDRFYYSGGQIQQMKQDCR